MAFVLAFFGAKASTGELRAELEREARREVGRERGGSNFGPKLPFDTDEATTRVKVFVVA